MRKTQLFLLTTLVMLFAACSQESADAPAEKIPSDPGTAVNVDSSIVAGPVIEIAPGLTMRILHEGDGAIAEAGQVVTVHYTGWLHDPQSENSRGTKFDSSVDRGDYFKFTLGAGRVIKGWDQGVAGMRIGETRELTIAPELAYGNRAVGNVIGANSTLVFEVELAGLSDGTD